MLGWTTPDFGWVNWSGLWDAVLPLAAIVIAGIALWGDRAFRREESLARLLEQFEANEHFVRLWRFDQITREGRDEWSIEPVDTGALTHDSRNDYRTLSLEALGSDWTSSRADMYQVYFFALRVGAWLDGTRWRLSRRTARRINDTFGHQLLLTLLNQRIIACRLRDPDRALNYFPTYYGLHDPQYGRLVDALADDYLTADDRLPPEVRDPLREKRTAIETHLQRPDVRIPSTDGAPLSIHPAE